MWFRDKVDRWSERAEVEKRPLIGRLLRGVQTLLDIGEHLVVDRALQTSAALAFTTIVSLVPLLAVSFALFKAIVSSEEVASKARGWLLATFLADSVSDVVAVLEQLLERAEGGAIGIVGFVVLLVTSLSLFLSVEGAFNGIWRVPSSRPLHRRLTAFYAVITLTPALLGLAAVFGRWMESGLAAVPFGVAVGATVLPSLLEIAALTLMYKLMPHTPVRWRSAAAGAVFAAIVFNLTKGAFNWYIIAVYKGSVSAQIYGSLALIPIFMLWVYISWIIVLGGVELAYMVQNRQNLSRALLRRRGRRAGFAAAPTGYLVARVFFEVGRHFREHGGGVHPGQVAAALQIPVEEVSSALQLLMRGGLVLQVDREGATHEVVPARPLDRIRLVELYALTDGDGYQVGELPAGRAAALEAHLARAVAAGRAELERDVASFLTEFEHAPAPEPEPEPEPATPR